jgi:hypothetical protein
LRAFPAVKKGRVTTVIYSQNPSSWDREDGRHTKDEPRIESFRRGANE